jgi:hypothetical protein
MKELPSNRVLLIVGGVIFAIMLWLTAGNKTMPEQNVTLARIENSAPKPATTETHEFVEHQSDVPVTYTQRMPSGGISVVTSSGNFNGSAVHVAVPDRFHKIQYLAGTDPQAVEYLKEKKAEHDQMVVDNGPMDVDLGAMSASLSTRSRKLAAHVEK